MNSKQCPNCGAQNAVTNQVCFNCGSNLIVQNMMPQQPMMNQPVMNQPGQPMGQPMMQPGMMYSQPKKTNPVLIIILAVVGVFAALIIIGLIFGGNKLENTTYSTSKSSGSITTTTEVHFGENGKGYVYIESKSNSGLISPVTKNIDFKYKVSGSNITMTIDGKNVEYKIDGDCIVNKANSSTRYCK